MNDHRFNFRTKLELILSLLNLTSNEFEQAYLDHHSNSRKSATQRTLHRWLRGADSNQIKPHASTLKRLCAFLCIADDMFEATPTEIGNRIANLETSAFQIPDTTQSAVGHFVLIRWAFSRGEGGRFKLIQSLLTAYNIGGHHRFLCKEPVNPFIGTVSESSKNLLFSADRKPTKELRENFMNNKKQDFEGFKLFLMADVSHGRRDDGRLNKYRVNPAILTGTEAATNNKRVCSTKAILVDREYYLELTGLKDGANSLILSDPNVFSEEAAANAFLQTDIVQRLSRLRLLDPDLSTDSVASFLLTGNQLSAPIIRTGSSATR